jgi:hypothetical protein
LASSARSALSFFTSRRHTAICALRRVRIQSKSRRARRTRSSILPCSFCRRFSIQDAMAASVLYAVTAREGSTEGKARRVLE